MNRLADDSPERQIPWLPGERLELALDSRTGAVTSPLMGGDVLTVTTHRAIRSSRASDMRITEIVPLGRIVHIEVNDVSRNSRDLIIGLALLIAGAILGWMMDQLFGVMLFSFLAGGIPALVAIFKIAGYVLPDDEGVLALYTSGSVLRHPLRSAASQRAAYLTAHRLYELIETAASRTDPPVPAREVQFVNDTGTQDMTNVLGSTDPNESLAATQLASVLRMNFEQTEEILSPDAVAEHLEQSISATAGASSYVTRQVVLDPERDQMGEGDYIWDLEFVAPDCYRVSQTGWSSVGEVSERWMTLGDDFFLDCMGWHWLETGRFGEELALNQHLTTNKYLVILRQGFPSTYRRVSAAGHSYLHVAYESITREALSAVLGNPSPMQGVRAAADLWIDIETHLLTKAEVTVADSKNGQRALFQQSFASYGANLGLVRPDAPSNPDAPVV